MSGTPEIPDPHEEYVYQYYPDDGVVRYAGGVILKLCDPVEDGWDRAIDLNANVIPIHGEIDAA